jgi:serine carboxypeptidase-like clade 2
MDDDEDHFDYNPYSWNNFSNTLFIEAPAGVGYSYCSNSEECVFDDDNSAVDNLDILLHWMLEKFPEYNQHDLYISGESYAGIYVPYLTRLLHLHN